MRWVLLVTAAGMAVAVTAGYAARPKPPLRFQATAPATLRAGSPAVLVRVNASEDAALTATLYRSSQKLQTWRASVGATQRRVRLALRTSNRRVGRYTLLLAASAGEETVFRTVRYRIVGTGT